MVDPAAEGVGIKAEEFVYWISSTAESEELQNNGSTFGVELYKSTGCFHLTKMKPNSFNNVKEELFLLQIDAKKEN